MTRIRWNEDDERFLEEHYANQPLEWVAKQLGRTAQSIVTHASRKGMTRRAPPEYHTFQMDDTPEKWSFTVQEGLTRITNRIIGRIQKRLGTLVEFGDVFNTGYLLICRAPYYHPRSVEGRLLRLFSDSGVNSKQRQWAGGKLRTELGCAWPPESSPRKAVE